MYIYTGGEPLVRKKDLIALCNKHSDCQFLSFTNATLIDEDFADEMLRVKNFIPAISVEGFEDGQRTDAGATARSRRLCHAMNILKDKTSALRHFLLLYQRELWIPSAVAEFLDQHGGMGRRFRLVLPLYARWAMTRRPELLPTPEQREEMYHRIRELSENQSRFSAMDFQNDGEFVGGCIAGGRRYLHINANGDVDPCVFIHYSNSNIRDKTLLECTEVSHFHGLSRRAAL